MSPSHHDREEETLIAYFQQMLAEVDDQEFDGELQSTSGDFTDVRVESTTQESNAQVLANANAAIASNNAQAQAQVAQVAAPAPTPVTAPVEAAPAVPVAEPSYDELRAAHPEQFANDDIFDQIAKQKAEEQAKAAKEAELRAAYPDQFAYDDIFNAPVPPKVEEVKVQESAPVIEQAPSIPRSNAEEAADAAMMAMLEGASSPSYEPQPQPQLATAAKPAEQTLDYATPPDSSLQRLLSTITPSAETQVETKTEVKVETKVETKVEPKVEPKVEVKVEAPAPVAKVEVAAPKVEIVEDITAKTPQEFARMRMSDKLHAINANWKNVDLGEQFQVLFFLVQGVRFAVPLIDLGGIFECEKITQLFGKPSWFMGITDVRGFKINIVDTLRWVMPEINDSPEKYPYLISLGKSEWSIGCDNLEGNRTLTSSQIKWREIPGNRPWLAGIVTSEKCALLHVNALISLFAAGADIEDLTRDLKEGEKGAALPNSADKKA